LVILVGWNIVVIGKVLPANCLSDSYFSFVEHLSKSVDEDSSNDKKNEQSGDSTTLAFEVRLPSKSPPIIVGE